jgi:alpha-L-fucosidase
MTRFSRREALAAAASTALFGPQALRAAVRDDAGHLTVPLPRQVVWQDCEVGVIFHFDMPLFAEGGRTHHNSIHETWDPEIYNPAELDTDQWVEAAKAMGARYAIFTATHFNGFMQWQSDLYPYGVKQASWRGGKGDVVKDFVESCRKANLKPGIYMSCFRNAWWKVDRYRVNYGKGGEGQAKFARTCEKMFEELCTRYGPLVQIWFDAGNIAPADGGPDLLPIADKDQPNMVFYHSPKRREHRWIGNESGYAGYPCWATMPDLETAEELHKGRGKDWRKMLSHGDPDGKLWSPGMVDTVLRNHHWFWYANTEHKIEPLDRLVKFYYQSVGRNCNLILGLTPAPNGLLPEPDFKRCAEFGAEIRRRFTQPIAETKGTGKQLTLELPVPQKIDHVMIMEDITGGERVRAYAIEGRDSSNTWQKLCDGISIGHKRIQQFAPMEVAAVKLTVSDSVATPLIRNLAVFHAG